MYVVSFDEMFWVGCMLGDVRVQGSGLEDGQAVI